MCVGFLFDGGEGGGHMRPSDRFQDVLTTRGIQQLGVGRFRATGFGFRCPGFVVINKWMNEWMN